MDGLLALALFAGGSVAILASGVFYVRFIHQRQLDRNRESYVIEWPSELSADDVLGWLESISGTLKTGPQRFFGVPTVVFETTADARGIVHRLHISHHEHTDVIKQLRTHVPGIRAIPDTSPGTEKWDTVVELGQRNLHRLFRIPEPARLSTTILGAVAPVGRNERVSLQIVVTPAVPTRLPLQGSSSHEVSLKTILSGRVADKDEITDRRAKLSEPNLLAVIRIAARAETLPAALQRVRGIYKALASARNGYTRFTVRWSFLQRFMAEALHRRMLAAVTPIIFPIQLTTTELSAFIAWPVGGKLIAGMPQGHARHLSPIEAIPRVGRVIGVSNMPGPPRNLAVSPKNRSRHMHIAGVTGSGKTTLLHNLIVQDLAAGSAVILLDPKGDLFLKTLNSIPKGRYEEVIVLDVNDTEYPVGFNILQGPPTIVAADLQALFDRLYASDGSGVMLPETLYHVVVTLMTTTAPRLPLTITDLTPLCVPTASQLPFSDTIIRSIRGNDGLSEFWQKVDNHWRKQRDAYFAPLMRRVWQLNNRPEIRNILGQSVSSFDMREALQTKKVILVNLSGLGSDIARLLGSLLLNAVWSAVKDGATDPSDPTFLYMDEFQDFLNLPISPHDMLAQARSMGLNMTMAHQFLGQLKRVPELLSAVEANAVSKVALGPSTEDAIIYARWFGPMVDEHDFRNQWAHEFIAKLATDRGVSPPVTGQTYDSARPTGSAKAVRYLSRKRFAKPRAEVEAEIRERRSIDLRPQRTARVGSEPWIDRRDQA